MNDQDIVKLFEKLKGDPDFNRPFDADESWKLIAERAGLSPARPEASYGFRDYLEYYIWQLTHAMLKPAAAAVAVFLLAITGWVSAANLSSNALPGDDLYSVKLGIEQARLTLAFSPDQRAALQVDFASRRLEEMVIVAAMHSSDEPETVQLAVEQVKTQVETLKERLTNQEAGNAGATELAKAIGRNAGAYKTTVAGTPELSVEVQEEVEQIINETEEQAVEVIMAAHELEENKDTARELAVAFDKELVRIQKEFGDDVSEQLDLAVKLKDEGLYRRAFQVLKEIEIEE